MEITFLLDRIEQQCDRKLWHFSILITRNTPDSKICRRQEKEAGEKGYNLTQMPGREKSTDTQTYRRFQTTARSLKQRKTLTLA